MQDYKVSVLFVCLGNICRSPSAHGIFQGLVERSAFAKDIYVDSCGTGDWHIGHAPDPRSAQAASKRGYDLSNLRARQLSDNDFERFDYILTMDNKNFEDVMSLFEARYPNHAHSSLSDDSIRTIDGKTFGLFLQFAGIEEPSEVPDPYYGGEQGFELVLDLLENAAERALARIVTQHQLG